MQFRKYTVGVLFLLLSFACGNELSAQTYATSGEITKANYITSSVIQSSIERRESNDSKSSGDLDGQGGTTYSIDGPVSVDRVSKQGYTVVPRAPLGFWWYVSCGTVMEYYDDMIVILFSNTTCNTSTIKLFNASNVLQATLTVTIVGDPNPLSAGQILTGSQSVKLDSIPGTLFATSAQGGSCSNSYQYQWQYSYNDTLYWNIEDAVSDSLPFEGGIDRNTYFRRKVVCGMDSMYTASVAVFLIPPFHAGTITTPSQVIPVNSVPPVVNATPASNGDCFAYSYQWQQSADGLSFSNISGAASQNLSYPVPVTGNIFLRRQSTCNTETKSTNTVLFRVQNSITPPSPVKSSIDSLLEGAGINIATLFNIYNDSVANNRPAPNPSMDSLEAAAINGRLLFQIDNGISGLDATFMDSLLNYTPADNIQGRIIADSNGTAAADTTPVFIPFIDDNTIQLYRSTGNYAALDSIVSDIPEVSAQEASYPLEVSLYSSVPEAQRTYIPQINTLGMKQSIVIDGTSIVERNQVQHYTASFYFAPGSAGGIQWVVKGGTIVSQNTNPSSGQVFADVRWESSADLPYIGLFDIGSNQYRIFPVFFYTLKCRIYPALQTMSYGQSPARLMSTTCNVPPGSSIQYQWQILDVYANTNWSDISGATNNVYQPSPLNRPWLMYRRLTRVYDSYGNLLSINVSSASSVKLFEITNNTYQVASYNVEYNTSPSITMYPAYGGMLVPPGGTYSYQWEVSVNDGPWQPIGTTMSFPGYPIRD
ncbi:MAG TPA: hypothetical protein PKD42_10245, partial [Chitinophagaceae bacterium]|nr:hypothetical protein [Chitinophagaceae bacterium]